MIRLKNFYLPQISHIISNFGLPVCKFTLFSLKSSPWIFCSCAWQQKNAAIRIFSRTAASHYTLSYVLSYPVLMPRLMFQSILGFMPGIMFSTPVPQNKNSQKDWHGSPFLLRTVYRPFSHQHDHLRNVLHMPNSIPDRNFLLHTIHFSLYQLRQNPVHRKSSNKVFRPVRNPFLSWNHVMMHCARFLFRPGGVRHK